MSQSVGTIRKLDETVINRIAAGEIIQRPANALKEMLENSLDAGAKNIQVTAKDGGLKLLQIQDNGCGIRKADLDIVCERFTTSKLREFEDLASISTYGFRGEALASISHVAHLTITTKISDSQCAYRAAYSDGKVTGLIKPCAGNQGTQITVEDLFYNVPTRRRALKSGSEEYRGIVDVISKYAIHNASVGFTVKKFGTSMADVKTPHNSSVLENVKIIYGVEIGKELLEVELNHQSLKFKMSAFVSSVNFSMSKKFVFLLFINNRLVDCSGLRKCLELMYATYIPKNSHPFIYISLDIDPRNVDVNVHPTKHEVHFLHEDEIIQAVTGSIENRLLSCNESRTMVTKTMLPTAAPASLSDVVPSTSQSSASSMNKSQATAAYNMVRTDCREQKLDAFLKVQPKPSQSTLPSTSAGVGLNPSLSGHEAHSSSSNKPPQQQQRAVRLTSVLELQEKVKNDVSDTLRETFQRHKFVGCVSRELALIQHNTKLYIVNTRFYSCHLFYQIIIFQFGNLGYIRFSTPANIYKLALMALREAESGWSEEDGSREELANFTAKLLVSKRDMLRDYFSLDINDKGELLAIPLLLENYVPDLSSLPMYVLRIASEVNWETETECFHTFCRETAFFYSMKEPKFVLGGDSSSSSSSCGIEKNKQQKEAAAGSSRGWRWTVEHALYPALRHLLVPPKVGADNCSLVEIADVHNLYKVFERC